MKKIKRTLIGMLTAVSMAFTFTAVPAMSICAAAEENDIEHIYEADLDLALYGEPFLPTGDALELEGQEVPTEEVERICEEIEERGGEIYEYSDIDLAPASTYTYSSRYFYDNVLADSTEKAFYNKLDSACRAVLTDTTDCTDVITYSGGSTAMRIASVEYTGIDKERARLIYSMFRFSNPQYYFLSSAYGFGSTSSGKKYLYLQYMNAAGYDFSKYAQRQSAQAALDSLTESWMADIDLIASDYEKELAISKKVIDYLTYDKVSVDGSHEDLQRFNQSIISGVLRQTTVCAGYTHLTSYFLNAAGIESFYINSEGHAWNLVKLYGNWYELDNTWADQDKGTNPYVWEIWRNKSHKAFLDYDIQNSRSGSHTYKSIWSGVALPATYYDTVQIPDPIYPTSVTLNKTELTLDTGNTFKLTADILPEYATEKTITWTSADTNIAAVSTDGTVTAKLPGTVKITAKTSNGLTAECTVTVKFALPDAGKGDINNDTKIDNEDYELLVLVIIKKNNATGSEYDMNSDTSINGKDLILLRRKIQGTS